MSIKTEPRSNIAILGAGWRARHFLRIARELSAQFSITGVFVRDAEKGKALEKEYGVKTYLSLDELLAVPGLSFVVAAIPAATMCACIKTIVQRGLPVLAETPPGLDLGQLIELHALVQQGAKIEVAEQYEYQPLLAAQIAVARSGRLGEIRHAQVSVAHGYHGLWLIRRLLGVGYANVSIRAEQFTAPAYAGPGRGTLPSEISLGSSSQVMARFAFPGKVAIYDFDSMQYSYWIRGPRILVRGEKGELCNREVRYLKDHATPIEARLLRQDAGQSSSTKEGMGHKMYLLGEEIVYRSPFGPVRLNDDELAMATCLSNMAARVNGSPNCSGLADALQDTYLNLMLDEALKTGQDVTTTTQPWAPEAGRGESRIGTAGCFTR